jgi:hypothetical protein
MAFENILETVSEEEISEAASNAEHMTSKENQTEDGLVMLSYN